MVAATGHSTSAMGSKKDDKGSKGASSSSAGSKSSGKMGANSSQTGGTKSAASKAGTAPGSKAPSSGKMGPNSSQASAVSRDTTGTGIGNTLGGGLRTSAAKTADDARAKAVSRGPGLLGSINSTKPTDQKRALTSIGLAIGDRYGLPGNTGIRAANEMAKTLAGEVGKYGQLDYDAAARTMTNRMDMMKSGYTGFGQTVKDMLGAYDANRYTSRTQVPSTLGAYGAYQAAKPGTATFQKGVTALANAMSPYSSIANVPEVAKATHYYSGPRTQSYQKGFQAFGPHKFGTPDVSSGYVGLAQQNSLQSPSPVTQMASLPKASRTNNLDSQIAAARDAMPQNMASAIPSPREQVGGYLGGVVGSPPQASAFPGRPGEMVGAFPAAQRPQSTFPGRPGEMPGAFPAEDRAPSTFPGRPMETAGAFPAARPGSTFPGRPSYAGAFPAEDRQPSSFPGRPELGPGAFPAARPQSTFPARPGYPGAFPAEDRQPTTFPGRPEFRGPGFPAAPQVASTFPGRPGEMPGAFPAAPAPATNPLRSFANIPASGFPQAQESGGFFAGLGDVVKSATGTVTDAITSVPGRVKEAITETIRANPNDPNAAIVGGWSNSSARQNPYSRGEGGQMWTGRESPRVVAEMQQNIEQILRQIFASQVAQG